MEVYAKTVVVGSPGMYNGNDIDEGAVYEFTLNFIKTYTYDKKVTANDGASNYEFGSSVAVSEDTPLAGADGKYGYRGPPMNLSFQEVNRGMTERGQFQEMELPQNMSLSGQ